jgi:hypothetical protein
MIFFVFDSTTISRFGAAKKHGGQARPGHNPLSKCNIRWRWHSLAMGPSAFCEQENNIEQKNEAEEIPLFD